MYLSYFLYLDYNKINLIEDKNYYTFFCIMKLSIQIKFQNKTKVIMISKDQYGATVRTLGCMREASST